MELEPNFWNRVKGFWVWKNVSKLKPKALEIEKIGVKPTPKEPPKKI